MYFTDNIHVGENTKVSIKHRCPKLQEFLNIETKLKVSHIFLRLSLLNV